MGSKRRAMVRGLFVVFEGIDGSGTSTQAALLHASLVRSGHKASITSEPTSGPIGHLIREIITKRVHVSNDQEVVDRELAYLFAADRFDHLHNDVDGIIARLARGYVSVSTRYYLSSFAYNAHKQEDFDLVKMLNKNFPMPDLTFYLDCPLNEAMRRITADGRGPDRNENLNNLSRVKQNYERALAQYAGQCLVLDATQGTSMLHEQIVQIVMEKLGANKNENAAQEHSVPQSR